MAGTCEPDRVEDLHAELRRLGGGGNDDACPGCGALPGEACEPGCEDLGWRVSLGTLDVLFTRDAARLHEIEKAARVVGTTIRRQIRDAEAAGGSPEPRRLLARADSAAARGHRVFQKYLRANSAREA